MSVLTKVAVFGSVISVAGAAFITSKMHENIEREEFHRKPVALLRKSKTAIDQLGHPIKTTRLDLGDTEKNRFDGLTAKLAIPVKGPKDKGVLYVQASREKAGDSWQMNHLELEVGLQSNKFTILSGEHTEESPPVQEEAKH